MDQELKNARNRATRARRRAEYFEGKVCAHCKTGKNLELDHIIPIRRQKETYKPGNGNVWLQSAAKREIELANCQPLCHTCHVEKTKKDGSLQ